MDCVRFKMAKVDRKHGFDFLILSFKLPEPFN